MYCLKNNVSNKRNNTKHINNSYNLVLKKDVLLMLYSIEISSRTNAILNLIAIFIMKIA